MTQCNYKLRSKQKVKMSVLLSLQYTNIRAHYFISCSNFFQINEYTLPPSLFESCTKTYVKRFEGFSENKDYALYLQPNSSKKQKAGV